MLATFCLYRFAYIGKDVKMGIKIPTQKIRLLTDEVEERIKNIRSTLSGYDLEKFDMYVKDLVNHALVYAKQKVPSKYTFNSMQPDYTVNAVNDYGNILRNIVTPIVAARL